MNAFVRPIMRGMSHTIFPLVTNVRPCAADTNGRVFVRAKQPREAPMTDEMSRDEMLANSMLNDDVVQSGSALAEIETIREAYTEKINAAIGADDDRLAIELSRQYRDEAFDALVERTARRRNVA